jgi:hypothetical protein
MYGLKTAAVVLFGATTGSAQMRITEYMYSGSGGEFVEFTNVGVSPIDMTGWGIEDDNFGGTGEEVFDLSGFGTVAPGESVIVTQDPALQFRFDWGLDSSVKIVELLGDSVGHNLGRNDAINLVDDTNSIIDALDYGDEEFVGSIRTKDASGWVTPAGLGADDPYEWVLSTVGDVQNSYLSAAGDIGNPGTHVIPEPATMALLLAGGAAAIRRRRVG